jgi:hypothetical protein
MKDLALQLEKSEELQSKIRKRLPMVATVSDALLW